jgi:hypothetical protein
MPENVTIAARRIVITRYAIPWGPASSFAEYDTAGLLTKTLYKTASF